MMKKIWLHCWRAYLKLGMFFYFKKIEIKGLTNIPQNKPVLILANHRNALLDALLIAGNNNGFAHFLTRAGVFKKESISQFLKSLQMLPVYRIRDGWGNLTNNNAIFEQCTKLLKNNEKVVIFPEGSHSLLRRVRPLSKGFTRIVFDTLEKHPTMDLQLIPVGINFQHTTGCPDEVNLIYGEAIAAQDFITENRNESVTLIKERVHSEMSKLTTHIPQDNYDMVFEKLTSANVDYLQPKQINKAIKNNLTNYPERKSSPLKFIKTIFRYLLILNLCIPYFIWKKFLEPKIVEREFVATFRFAIALTLVPIYLLIIASILGNIFGLSAFLYYIAFSLVLALFAVKL